MSPSALSSILVASLALSASLVVAQDNRFPPTPLSAKRFPTPTDLPYKVDTDVGLIRGTQLGYNICNGTTENQESLCQTSHTNAIGDFCLWAPSIPGKEVGEIEGEMIAWCTKKGHGTRLIPQGALTGVQFLKTPDYLQVVGFIDQTMINMIKGDYGGEMDPHGADLRGNPLGGVMYSNAWTGSSIQAVEWTNFMGSNAFCLKACDPSKENAARNCEHIYDRIGCAFNAPNAAKDGVFESCDAENADFPGVYTGADGQVTTYTQPPESLGPITTVPYVARVPASSNCVPFESAKLFTDLPSVAAPAPTGASGASGLATARPTGSAAAGASASRSSGASPTPSGEASTLAAPVAGFLGVVFAALFLA